MRVGQTKVCPTPGDDLFLDRHSDLKPKIDSFQLIASDHRLGRLSPGLGVRACAADDGALDRRVDVDQFHAVSGERHLAGLAPEVEQLMRDHPGAGDCLRAFTDVPAATSPYAYDPVGKL